MVATWGETIVPTMPSWTSHGKQGYKMIDAEMNVMEPVDRWERYIDPAFKDRAPKRLSERRWDIRTLVEGEVMAMIPGGDWPAVSQAEEEAMATRYAEEIARDFDPASQLLAMDKEGLDVAVLYPTSGMYAIAFETMDAAFAAICKTYNDWLYDYQRPIPAACTAPRSPTMSTRRMANTPCATWA